MYYIICTDNEISVSKLDLMGNINENYIFKNKAIESNQIFNLEEFKKLVNKIKEKIIFEKEEKVYFSLSSKEVQYKDIENFLKLSEENIDKNVLYDGLRSNYDNMKVIHSIPYKYKLDSKLLKNPIGLKGKELWFNYNEFSIDKEIFFNLKNSFEEYGIKITNFTFDFYNEYLTLKKEYKDFNFLSFKKDFLNLVMVKDGVIQNFFTLDIGYNMIVQDLKTVLDINDEKVINNLIKDIGISYDDNITMIVNYEGKSIPLNIDTISSVIYERLFEFFSLIKEKYNITWTPENKNFIFGEDIQKIKNIDKSLEHIFEGIFKIVPYQLVQKLKFSEQMHNNLNLRSHLLEKKIKEEKKINIESKEFKKDFSHLNKEKTVDMLKLKEKHTMTNKFLNFMSKYF